MNKKLIAAILAATTALSAAPLRLLKMTKTQMTK